MRWKAFGSQSGSISVPQPYKIMSAFFANSWPVLATGDGKPLTVGEICEIIRRRVCAAGIDIPGVHAFRRAFALNCLRNGMDVILYNGLWAY